MKIRVLAWMGSMALVGCAVDTGGTDTPTPSTADDSSKEATAQTQQNLARF